MAHKLYDIPCVGGPFNGQMIGYWPDVTEAIITKDGKYLYSPEHYRQGECWVWHKFIR
jgi:hypothetical protein